MILHRVNQEKKVCQEKTIKFDVFCSCRFPWVWCHSKNKDLNIAQCDSFLKCYHGKCENIQPPKLASVKQGLHIQKSWENPIIQVLDPQE